MLNLGVSYELVDSDFYHQPLTPSLLESNLVHLIICSHMSQYQYLPLSTLFPKCTYWSPCFDMIVMKLVLAYIKWYWESISTQPSTLTIMKILK